MKKLFLVLLVLFALPLASADQNHTGNDNSTLEINARGVRLYHAVPVQVEVRVNGRSIPSNLTNLGNFGTQVYKQYEIVNGTVVRLQDAIPRDGYYFNHSVRIPNHWRNNNLVNNVTIEITSPRAFEEVEPGILRFVQTRACGRGNGFDFEGNPTVRYCQRSSMLNFQDILYYIQNHRMAWKTIVDGNTYIIKITGVNNTANYSGDTLELDPGAEVFNEQWDSINVSRWVLDNATTTAVTINPAGQLNITSATANRQMAISLHPNAYLNTSNKTTITMWIQRDSASALDANQPSFYIWFLRSTTGTSGNGTQTGTGYRFNGLCESNTQTIFESFIGGSVTTYFATNGLNSTFCSRDTYHNLTIDIDFSVAVNNINISMDGYQFVNQTVTTYWNNTRKWYISYGMGQKSTVKMNNLTVFDYGASGGGGSVTAAPQWFSPTVTNNAAGQYANFSVNWTLLINNTANLSSFTFEYDNGTSTFTNLTIRSMTGTSNLSVFQTGINSTIPSFIRWRVYANNTDGMMNVTDIQSFTTSGDFIIQRAVDEITLQNIWFNLSAANSSATTSNGNNLFYFNGSSSAFPQGLTTLTFANTSYYSRHAIYNFIGAATENKVVYLLSQSYANRVGLTIYLVDFVNFPINNGLVNLQKTIGGSNVILDQAYTTTSGLASFQVDCLSTYTINVTTPTGLNNIQTIILNCNGDNTFRFQMSSGSNYPNYGASPFQNVTANLYPTADTIYDQFTLIQYIVFTSVTGNLQYYNLSIYYSNGTLLHNAAGTNANQGNLSFNLSKAGKEPFLVFNTTFKEFTMSQEYSWTTIKYVSVISNGTAPQGLNLPGVQGAFPGFVFIIIPIILAMFATGFLVAIAPATQGGAGLFFFLALTPFVAWGWLNPYLWVFFGVAGLAFTYLYSGRIS